MTPTQLEAFNRYWTPEKLLVRKLLICRLDLSPIDLYTASEAIGKSIEISYLR